MFSDNAQFVQCSLSCILIANFEKREKRKRKQGIFQVTANYVLQSYQYVLSALSFRNERGLS